MPKPKSKGRLTRTKKPNTSPPPRSKRKGEATMEPSDEGSTPKRRSKRVKAPPKETGSPNSKSANEDYNRTLAKDQTSDVDDKDRQIKDLSDKLSKLSEDYNHLSEKYQVCYGGDTFFGGSFPACFLSSHGGTWGRDLWGMSYQVENWAFNHGLSEIEDIERLSDDGKKGIISSLEGYCVQGDYNSLVLRFPESIRGEIPLVFLSMFIVKDIVEKLYTNPYWYLGPDPTAATQDDHRRQQQEEFANNLYAVDRKFEKANHELYQIWRVTTCRLANIYGHRDRGPNHEFGEATKEYRDTLVRSMVADILLQKTAQLLLKDPKKIKPGDKPYDQLLKIYNRAAQDAINMSFWAVEPSIHTLDMISPEFEVASGNTKAHAYHYLPDDDTRLDGKPILGLSVPGLLTREVERFDPSRGCYPRTQTWRLKAHVFVEDAS